jgi:hypothetical protein
VFFNSLLDANGHKARRLPAGTAGKFKKFGAVIAFFFVLYNKIYFAK